MLQIRYLVSPYLPPKSIKLSNALMVGTGRLMFEILKNWFKYYNNAKLMFVKFYKSLATENLKSSF